MALTPIGRFSFPELYHPKAAKAGDKPKFSTLHLYKVDELGEEDMKRLKEMKATANKVCQEEFGVNIGEEYRGKVIESPFKKSEQKPDYMPPGHIYVRFSGNRRPGVVDHALNAIPEHSDNEVYGGCWGYISYGVYAYNNSGNRGVAFGLNNVQKIRDGEPFGTGQSRPEDDFTAQDGPTDSEFASTAADDIPF